MHAAKCAGIASFQACADAIADGSSISNAVMTQHATVAKTLDCTDADLIVTPQVRTKRGDMEFSVNGDARFTRHRRETISVFDIKKAVDGLVSDGKSNDVPTIKKTLATLELSVKKQLADQAIKNAAVSSVAASAIKQAVGHRDKVNGCTCTCQRCRASRLCPLLPE